MKQIIIIITNIIHFILNVFRIKNLFWTWNQYKQNRIDAATDRNNTSVWYQIHLVKPRINYQEWYRSIKQYFFPVRETETKINTDNLISNL